MYDKPWNGLKNIKKPNLLEYPLLTIRLNMENKNGD